MGTAQPGPDLGGAGRWQDHFLNAEGHNPAGCCFRLRDKPSEVRNSYGFLKISRESIPHRKSALGSPEVYNPPTLRCFSVRTWFYGNSVYGRRMAFTWQSKEPVANLTHFCTVCFAYQCYRSQTLEENLFRLPILFDFCNILQEITMQIPPGDFLAWSLPRSQHMNELGFVLGSVQLLHQVA